MLSLLLPGCSDTEPARRVSLAPGPGVAPARQQVLSGTTAIQFGFDLRLGPKEDVRIYLPLLKYLERETSRSFAIRFTEGYEDTVDNLGRGITQFAALGPVNAVIAMRRHKVDCLVMGLNESGRPEYRSVIITRPDSPIQEIGNLKGMTFAFGDRYSTQGHLIPRKMLNDHGIRPGDLKSFIYSGSHANTARAVLNGLYDAGGIQDTFAERLLAEGRVRILAQSEPYPSSLICYHLSLDRELIGKVKNALLALDPRGTHRAMLPGWEKSEMPAGFTGYRPDSFAEIRRLIARYGLDR